MEKHRNQVFYKVLNEKLNHHGFQYKVGLNIDTIAFNPDGAYEAGGIYFTTLQFISRYLDFGCYIAEIIIPENARMWPTAKEEERWKAYKWKADQIIIKNIVQIEEHEMWNNEYSCLEAVKQNGYALKYIKNPTYEICLAAVKQNGCSLKYVKDQTREICVAAVIQCGYALQFVKKQNDEICLSAVKQEGLSLMFVKKQNEEICLEAINENPESIKYVKKVSNSIYEAVKRKYAECNIR